MLIKLAAACGIAFFIGGQRYALAVLAVFCFYHVLNFVCEMHSEISAKMLSYRIAEAKKNEVLLKEIQETSKRDKIRDAQQAKECEELMRMVDETLRSCEVRLRTA